MTEISLPSRGVSVGLGLRGLPLRALGIITQNGNAYTDRFGPGVLALADWWKHRAAGHAAVAVDDTRVQWEAGLTRSRPRSTGFPPGASHTDPGERLTTEPVGGLGAVRRPRHHRPEFRAANDHVRQ